MGGRDVLVFKPEEDVDNIVGFLGWKYYYESGNENENQRSRVVKKVDRE